MFTLMVEPRTLDSNWCRLSHCLRSIIAEQHGLSDTCSDISIRCHSDDDLLAAAAMLPIVSACRTVLAFTSPVLWWFFQSPGAVVADLSAEVVGILGCWLTNWYTLSVSAEGPHRLRHCTSCNTEILNDLISIDNQQWDRSLLTKTSVMKYNLLVQSFSE